MGRNIRIVCWMLALTVAVHLVIYEKESSIISQHLRRNGSMVISSQVQGTETKQGDHGEGNDTDSSDADKQVVVKPPPKGDGTLHKEISAASLPFVDGHPKQLVILGYQRVGSSFFGQIFDHNPHFFYIYEPLDAVYAEMYGLEGGNTVPSDITYLPDGTPRDIPQDEKDAVHKLLSDILNCRISDLPQGFILHKYWYFLSENFAPSWRPYRACLKEHHILKAREECWSQFLSKVCPSRFGTNIEHQNVCKDLLKKTEVGDIEPYYGSYKLCLSEAYAKAKPCISLYEKRCSKARMWATKTVRGTMDELDGLLAENPNMRVIHLLRDPRPVVVSRSGKVSYRGIFTGDINKDHAGDIIKEAHMYCGTVVRDLVHSKTLEEKYPGKLIRVIYEDFAQNPSEYAKAIYQYLDEDIPESITSWIHKNTQGKDERKNARMKMNAWKKKMTYQQAESIVEECSEFYELLNYKWPYRDS